MRIQDGRNSEVDWAPAWMAEKQDKAIRPAWTAIERSPSEGRRRRNVAAAMEKAMKALGPGFAFEKTGSIWKGPVEIMKYDGNNERNERKKSWQRLDLGDWNDMLKNTNEE